MFDVDVVIGGLLPDRLGLSDAEHLGSSESPSWPPAGTRSGPLIISLRARSIRLPTRYSRQASQCGGLSRGWRRRARGRRSLRSERVPPKSRRGTSVWEAQATARRRTGLFTGNIDGRASCSGPTVDLPRRNERAEERMAFAITAPAHTRPVRSNRYFRGP